MRLPRASPLAILLGAAAAASAVAQPPPDTVPYIPTATPVVSAMLELADVGRADVLYDLGSGDGRIVISAARVHGASGMGFEIDGPLVRASRAAASAAGVDSLVSFVEMDLFAAELRPATVVTLYLSPELNLRLRPKLLDEMEPGTRIVSHAFHMGDWSPDSVVHVGSGASRATIYLWVVPAELDGFWQLTMDAPGGATTLVLELTQRFQELSGALRRGGFDIGRVTGRVRGTAVGLIVTDGSHESWLLEGRLAGGVMEGTYRRPGLPGRPKWRASRFSSPDPGP